MQASFCNKVYDILYTIAGNFRSGRKGLEYVMQCNVLEIRKFVETRKVDSSSLAAQMMARHSGKEGYTHANGVD